MAAVSEAFSSKYFFIIAIRSLNSWGYEKNQEYAIPFAYKAPLGRMKLQYTYVHKWRGLQLQAMNLSAEF